MKEISKDKITGIVGTVVFHALVVLLLYFLVMSKPPQEPEAGLAVVMGEEYNMTEVEIVKPEPEPAPKPQPQPVPQKPAPEKPMITQKSEESMAVDSLQAKEREEALLAEKLEAERKRKEEEAMAKAANLMANAFGKGSGMSRKSDEVAEEGSSKGSPDSGMEYGATATSGMGTYDLEGRSLGGDGSLPKPVYNVQEEGRVVVTVTVNPEGRVISANINRRTGTTSLALRNAALNAAKSAVFNRINGLNNQEGTITYYFKLK